MRRPTRPTRADVAIEELARDSVAAVAKTAELDRAHALAKAVAEAIAYTPDATDAHTTAAEALAGKARVSDAEAQQATGATIVRQIRPGQGVTMDYRRERVTIETDPKSGKIVRAYCG